MNIQKKINRELLTVEKPGRYTGGEIGICSPGENAALRICASFPDMYEVGMSNLSLKIIYSRINVLEDISCERVFSPAPDMEKLLEHKQLPLFSLESGTPLSNFDIVAFSYGYELLATNVLAILQAGGIPITAEERKQDDPVIIAGGPGITNPLPLHDFFDAVLIGEAEEELEPVLLECREMKKRGGGREDIISAFRARECWWYPEKKEKTKIHTWKNFGMEGRPLRYYPVPNIKTVQDHGVVEIMRGCINGCRFCHAGYFYRPCREKSIEQITEEVKSLVFNGGYREITLSSLSSGDYSCIWELLSTLNDIFSRYGVSFSLPSLRINTFSLENLKHLSAVRKSGLTFAVETPNDAVQKAINKKINRKHIIEIIRAAKNYGWKQAKFYFMIGLPGFQKRNEAAEIVSFIQDIYRETRMNLNINIGTFVPKPHTPFQWEEQLDLDSAQNIIYAVRDGLRGRQYKIAYHSPLLSHLEGIIARGNEQVSKLIVEAFTNGARFDAWEEYFQKDVWIDALRRVKPDVTELPWNSISLGISETFLKKEQTRSGASELTPRCEENCEQPCGKCTKELKLIKARELTVSREASAWNSSAGGPHVTKYLFCFSKTGKARFLGHLNCMTIFERAFLRAGVHVKFTEGFNPKPKIEFAHPLMLGIESEGEIAGVQCMREYGTEAEFLRNINGKLPEGIQILRARNNEYRKSLMSHFRGAAYRIVCANNGGSVMEKLQRYAEKEPGIIDGLKASDEAANIGTGGEREKTIDLTVRHEGKAGNLKTILAFLSDTGGITDFLTSHPVIRLTSYTKNGKGQLVPFF